MSLPEQNQKPPVRPPEQDTWDFGLPYSPPTSYTGNYATDVEIMLGVYDPYDQEELTQEGRAAAWKRKHRVAYNRLLRKQHAKEAKRNKGEKEMTVFTSAFDPTDDKYPF